MKASLVCAFAVLCAASVAGSTTQRVLFIGNSYTYANDLPNLYRQLATSLLPGVTVTVDSDTAGGRKLGQAAQSASVRQKLAAGNFDFLVLQEQSQMGGVPTHGGAPDSWKNTRLASEVAIRDVFTPAANKAGATVVFFATWGRRKEEPSWGWSSFLYMQRSLSDGYTVFADIAEREACGRVVQGRAGEVFKKMYEFSQKTSAQPSDDASTPFYQLYSGDGSHPALSGSYATAWALFTAITGNAAPYNAGTTFRSSLSEGLAAQIAGLAQEVWTEHASVAPEIKMIQGYYPTSTYVVRADKVSLWGAYDLADLYDLTVQGGAVYWKHKSASVTSVSEFAAKVEWSNGEVFANAKAVCGPKGSMGSPATSAPPTVSPPTPAPQPPTTAPQTVSPPTSAPPTVSPPTPVPQTVSPPTPAPPTVSPPTPVPQTVSPPTPAPPTVSPPTPVPQTVSPPTPAPPTVSPPTPVPQTVSPPTPAPPTVSPPTPVPQTVSPPTPAPLTPSPPTSAPTASPSTTTTAPTASPSTATTSAPTASPSTATTAPTASPSTATTAPTASPSTTTTSAPTASPSTATTAPTASPSTATTAPTASPSTATTAPTASPSTTTTAPTASPSTATTSAPTASPSTATTAPTASPSTTTTSAPTASPSTATTAPTASPSTATTAPTASPSTATTAPTASPSTATTSAPTASPSTATTAPTASPSTATTAPTASPSTATAAPTASPSTATTSAPTASPSTATTSAPTASPSTATTSAPTASPSTTTTAPTASPGTSAPARSIGGQDSSDSGSDKTWIAVVVAVLAVLAMVGVGVFFSLQRKRIASHKFTVSDDMTDDLNQTPFTVAEPTEMVDHLAVTPAFGSRTQSAQLQV